MPAAGVARGGAAWRLALLGLLPMAAAAFTGYQSHALWAVHAQWLAERTAAQGLDSLLSTTDTIRAHAATMQSRLDDRLTADAAHRNTLAARSAVGLAATLAGTLLLLALLARSQRSAGRALLRLRDEMASRQADESARARAFELAYEARRQAQDEADRHRLAEQNLSDRELHLATTLASIGAGFIATDRQGRVTRMNSMAEQITGWPQQAGLGQPLRAVFDAQDGPAQAALDNPVDQMAEPGLTAQAVRRVAICSRQGLRLAVDLQAGVTRDTHGALRGAALVFNDITRQLRDETESARLAAIVSLCNDAVVGKTLDGRITDWNGGAERLFGYSAQEAIGQPVQMLMPSDRLDEEMRLLADLTHGIAVPAFDTVRRTKSGELRQVLITLSPIRDAQGRIVGASKIARDITLQRRAEAALRNSEARLRFTLESAQIGDWDLDVASGRAQCSLQHDRCFGYSTAQADWGFERFAQHVHPDDRAYVLQSHQQALDGRQDWHLQCRVVWPDASLHWISLHGSLFDSGGAPSHMLGIVTDITAQKQAEQAGLRAQQLALQNRQIQLATQRKSQFLANRSHELRTPLNAIIGFADLLHSGAVKADAPQHQVFVGHIRSSGRHLLQLINDVLDLAKIESGKFDFHPPAPVAACPGPPRILVIDAQGEPQARMVQALAHAGFSVDVAASARQALQQAGAAAYDGITLNLARPDHGGLAVLQDIRRQGASHEAPVLGMSMPAADGTVASFAIANVLCKPMRIDEVVRSMAPFRQPGPRRCSVMVIDDDAIALDLMRSTLAGIGIDAQCFLQGRQALRGMDQYRPDAVILDLMMPDFDGFAVLGALRQMPAWRHTPVFVWTCLLLSRDERASLALSAQAVLAKGGGAVHSVLDNLRAWRPPRQLPSVVVD